MKFLHKRIIVFFTNECYDYTNAHGVGVHYDVTRQYINVGADITPTQEKKFSLSILSEFDSLEEFIEAFSIKNFDDVLAISSKDIMRLYDKGKAEILCSDANDHCYGFKSDKANCVTSISIGNQCIESVPYLSYPEGMTNYALLRSL